jgi:hypothetical protein
MHRVFAFRVSYINISFVSCIHTFVLTFDQARIQEFLVEGDDMDEEKTGRGLETAVEPKRGPGAELLVGVKGPSLL